jgi:phage virion morphogenesis protein
MLDLRFDKARANDQLELLLLDANKRRRILRTAGRVVRKQSRQRLRNQENIGGTKWQQRSNGKKTRMMRKLGRHMIVKTTANKAEVTFGNQRVGQIARAHQEGVTDKVTKEEVKKRYGTPDYGAPATRDQAKALRAEGYKVRRQQSKGWKTPSLRWIQDNLTIGQAGLILRFMRKTPKKDSWDIKLPERSFLGQDNNEQHALANMMLDEAMRLK